ncbi:MAG: adenylyltransferase/cytidyltransferase family protein [Nanoarchaeota archaeon]|nr:adenylyltransferase/cytidyltransferase family protein [Nanoarchaeota archaeon]
MKTVMAFGSFDVVHAGHSHYLAEAKKLGHLIVVVARSSNISKFKGFEPQYSDAERVSHVAAWGIADEVVLGNSGDVYSIVKERKPDTLALGYDQRPTDDVIRSKVGSIEIVRISAFKPEEFKSSKLKLRS